MWVTPEESFIIIFVGNASTFSAISSLIPAD